MRYRLEECRDIHGRNPRYGIWNTATDNGHGDRLWTSDIAAQDEVDRLNQRAERFRIASSETAYTLREIEVEMARRYRMGVRHRERFIIGCVAFNTLLMFLHLYIAFGRTQ